VSAEAGSVDLINAPDFEFTCGDGSGMSGFSVLKVAADGRTSYVFMEYGVGRQIWKYASFTVDPQTMAELRAMLQRGGYFRLKKSYTDTGIADGTQRFVKVIASGKRKGVWCDNYFPRAVEKIREFAERRIIRKHPAEIAGAVEVEIDWRNAESVTFEQ
jgi:hypothetical protein